MVTAVVSLVVMGLQGGYLGKSDAQILAMGRQKWFAYYTAKQGDSTADTCDAEARYGEVLKRRNDKLAARRDKQTRESVRKARPELTAFALGAYEVGQALTGGGTLWNLFNAGIAPNVEEALGAFVGIAYPTAKQGSPTSATVSKQLDALMTIVKGQSRSIEEMSGSGGGMEAATKGMMKARLALAAIDKLVGGRPSIEAKASYAACLRALELVRREAPTGG